MVTLVASWGFMRGFQRLDLSPVLSWFAVLALICSGLAAINAGLFPLPDPRHTDSLLALIGGGTFLLPVLLPSVLWKLHATRSIKVYLVINTIVLTALIPIMSGLIQRLSMAAGVEIPGFQVFLNTYQGLLQRIVGLVVFLPVGMTADFLTKRIKSLP